MKIHWGMTGVLALGLSLAFTGLDARSEPDQTPAAKSSFVITPDGVKIHFIEAGPATPKSPALVFVPGWTMPGWIWEQQIEHFSKTHRVVALDPRSQGESSKPTEGHYPAARARDIKAVMDQLKLGPAVLVGWSMAVSELAAYVDQFGTDKVAGLVFVDDTPASVDPKFAKTILDFAAGFLKDRRAALAPFVRSWFKKPQSEEYLNRVIEASLGTPTDSAVALLVGRFSTDYRPALVKIDRPTLIVCAQSPFLSLCQETQQRIAGSQIEVFEDAGHALFVDDAARFNTLVDKFLSSSRP